jgi:F-type H+-transporting ATPase subunit alpha
MKQIAGSLRLDLAAFRDLEAFAQLGTELDAASARQLDRGRRMTELLKQPQYTPYGVYDQIISIFAGAKGYLDDLPVARVLEFERGLLRHVHDEHPELIDELRREKKIGDALDARLREVIAGFKEHFVRQQAGEQPPAPAEPKVAASA